MVSATTCTTALKDVSECFKLKAKLTVLRVSKRKVKSQRIDLAESKLI